MTAEIALDGGALPIESAGEGDSQAVSLPPPTGMLALIDRYMRDPTVDIDKFERILEMKERLDVKEAEREFNEAMGRIARKLADVRIVKTKSVRYDIDKNNKARGQAEAFKFAPLEDIDKILRPFLIEEEITLSDTTEMSGEGLRIVVTRATHRAGHFREAAIPLPLDTSGGKSNVQGMGSTYSYGRRYNRVALFNIVTLDDDDGSGGTLDADQIEHILAQIETARAGPKFLKYVQAEAVEKAGSLEAAVATIPQRNYRMAVTALDDLIAKRENTNA